MREGFFDRGKRAFICHPSSHIIVDFIDLYHLYYLRCSCCKGVEPKRSGGHHLHKHKSKLQTFVCNHPLLWFSSISPFFLFHFLSSLRRSNSAKKKEEEKRCVYNHHNIVFFSSSSFSFIQKLDLQHVNKYGVEDD